MSAAFTQDGRFALTGSHDCTARLWNLTTSPISSQVLKWHNKHITTVAISPDKRFALLGSADDTASLWHLEYVDKTLSLLDHLLIIKLSKYDDLLLNDSRALERLKILIKRPNLTIRVAKLIELFFYEHALSLQ